MVLSLVRRNVFIAVQGLHKILPVLQILLVFHAQLENFKHLQAQLGACTAPLEHFRLFQAQPYAWVAMPVVTPRLLVLLYAWNAPKANLEL